MSFVEIWFPISLTSIAGVVTIAGGTAFLVWAGIFSVFKMQRHMGRRLVDVVMGSGKKLGHGLRSKSARDTMAGIGSLLGLAAYVIPGGRLVKGAKPLAAARRARRGR